MPEEFYDLSADPAERSNLIADPSRRAEIDAMRDELLGLMRRTGDPFAEAFVARDDKTLVPALLKKLNTKHAKAPKKAGGE